jgi:hypothetical protein
VREPVAVGVREGVAVDLGEVDVGEGTLVCVFVAVTVITEVRVKVGVGVTKATVSGSVKKDWLLVSTISSL